MEYDKIKNVKRNIIYGFVNKIILMFCPFIIRSIIIMKLSVEYVGLSSLFSSVLQVLSLAELGFGTAIVYSMYKPIATNDIVTINALLNFYKKIYRIIGSIILVCGICIFPFIQNFISGEIPPNINIKILYVIYLFNTVISYFSGAYKQSLLIAHQRNDVENNIISVASIIMYLLQIIVLTLFRNYYMYIILLPISTVFINVSRNFLIKKMYPEYYCNGKIENSLKKDMYKRVFGLALTRICQVCRNSFDSIIISSFLGLAVLGKYQNYYYIMNTIIGFLSIVTSSVVAGIGNSIVTKTIDENYLEFKNFSFIYNWIATWCTVCLLCLYQPFMNLWLGKEFMFPFELVIYMCIYFYGLKVGDIVSVYKEATGIYWEDKIRPIIESIVNLILNIVLVKSFGVYGVVMSTIFSIVFINIPWSACILFKIYFKKNVKEYFIVVLKNSIKLIVVCIITYLICGLVSFDGIIEIVIKGIICVCVPNILIILLNYKSSNLKNNYIFIKKYIGNRRET